ncbi:MAG: DEAD/DEAH box helicase [Micrococcales bacterium]
MTLVDEVLFDYQAEAAQRIFEARRILLADQPGLGKTLEVLGALEIDGLFERPSNILILTPIINAQTTWLDSIERFIRPRYEVGIIDASKGTAKQKSKQFQQVFPDVPVFVIANHNAIDMTKNGVRVSELNKTVYDAIIIDESHLVLPINNDRKMTNFWKGLSTINTLGSAIKVAVSGTPDRGKLENRYGTWKFLEGHGIGSRWQWLEENFWITEQRVSKSRTIKATAGIKNQRSWLEKDRLWMIRRTKNEVLPQLPPKRYVDVEIELEPEQRTAYFTEQLKYETKLFSKGEDEQTADAMLFALRSRQQAICGWTEDYEPIVGSPSAKLEWLLEWLSERGFIEFDTMADNRAKVVIVSQFTKVLHWLKTELANRGITAEVLAGDTSDAKRIWIQQQFQQGDLRIVLLSGNMGVGINLDKADDLIMLDMPYDPDRIEQIEDRVHRASSNHSVTIWNLIAINTIDHAVMEKVSKRFRLTRKLLDGSRGVDFARKMLDKENK